MKFGKFGISNLLKFFLDDQPPRESQHNRSPTDISQHQYGYGDDGGSVKVTPRFVQVQSFDLDDDDNGDEADKSNGSNLEQQDISDVSEIQENPNLSKSQNPNFLRTGDPRLDNSSDGNNDGQQRSTGPHSVLLNNEDSTSEGQVKDHLLENPFHQQNQEGNNLRSSLIEGNYGDVQLTTSDDNDDVSSVNVHDDLSEYNLSTLSGGEL